MSDWHDFCEKVNRDFLGAQTWESSGLSTTRLAVVFSTKRTIRCPERNNWMAAVLSYDGGKDQVQRKFLMELEIEKKFGMISGQK